jgi:hypothetical protein
MAVRNFEAKGFFLDSGVAVTGQTAVMDLPLLTGVFTRAIDNEVKIKGSTDGSCTPATVATINDGYTMTAAFTVQDTSPRVLSMMMGEAWKATASLGFSESVTLTVPSTSPYEIVNATAIGSGATAPDIQVTVLSVGAFGAPIPLQVITGAATTSAVQLTAASNKLVFHANYAGATVKVAYKSDKATIQTLGIETSTAFTNQKFMGRLCLTETGVNLWMIAYLQYKGGFTFNVGTAGDQTLEYEVVTPTGLRSGLQFALKATA